QVVVGLAHGRVAEELRDGGQRRWRARVQEGGAGRSVPVASVLFEQDAAYRQEIAQDADAAFGCRAVAGDGGDVARTFPHGPEDIQIDRRLQSRRALMRLVRSHGRVQSLETSFQTLWG